MKSIDSPVSYLGAFGLTPQQIVWDRPSDINCLIHVHKASKYSSYAHPVILYT